MPDGNFAQRGVQVGAGQLEALGRIFFQPGDGDPAVDDPGLVAQDPPVAAPRQLHELFNSGVEFVVAGDGHHPVASPQTVQDLAIPFIPADIPVQRVAGDADQVGFCGVDAAHDPPQPAARGQVAQVQVAELDDGEPLQLPGQVAQRNFHVAPDRAPRHVHDRVGRDDQYDRQRAQDEQPALLGKHQGEEQLRQERGQGDGEHAQPDRAGE